MTTTKTLTKADLSQFIGSEKGSLGPPGSTLGGVGRAHHPTASRGVTWRSGQSAVKAEAPRRTYSSRQQ
ncbi:MAG: hypothetical protein M3Z96_00280 [Pseudomonadota bacterium]|nr:hypothetical protein [Pseudomonadota bacterium]